MVVLKKFLQENTWAGVYIVIMFQARSMRLHQKETQVYSCIFHKISYYVGHLSNNCIFCQEFWIKQILVKNLYNKVITKSIYNSIPAAKVKWCFHLMFV